MNRARFAKVWAAIISACIAFTQAKCQQTLDPALSTGSPTSSYLGTDIENVNSTSGNLRISIPLLHLPGRGLDLDIGLFYNSKVWASTYVPPPPRDPGLPPGPATVKITQWGKLPVGGLTMIGSTLMGWNLGHPKMGLATHDEDGCTQFDANGNCLSTLAAGTWAQDDGTLIALSRASSDGGTTYIPPMGEYSSFSDGNFALLTSQGLRYRNGLLANSFIDANSVWHQTLEDTNGNLISCTVSSKSFVITGCVDTVGRTIGLTNDATTGYPLTMTYLDSSGTSRTITFSYTTFTVRYPFGGTNTNCIQDGGAAATLPLLTSVTLANNLSYRFEYLINGDGSTTGEISKIIYPTGGYVRYIYDFAPLTDNNFLTGCGNIGMIAQDRMVIQRIVSPDGTAAAEQQPWRYNFSTPTQLIDGQVSTVMKVTDPLGNSTSFIKGQFGQGLVNRIDYSDANGNLLKTIKSVVELGGGSGGSTDPYGGTPRYKSQTTILADTNQQAQIIFSYGPFNNVIEKDETDWGAGAPGAVLRKSTFSYLNDFNVAYAGDNVHILDRVRNATVCDAGSTFCSQSTTDYDTTGLTSTSSNPVVQHDYTNFSIANTLRGNPTQVSRFLNTTGSNVITTNIYNDVGNLIQITDPNSNITSFGYADNYANGTPTQRTSAYVTQITQPVTSGVNHITRSQYYFNTGLTAATCGENFPSGTACSAGLTGTRADYQSMTYDLMGRTSVVTLGDGGQTTATYNEASLPVSTASSTKIDSSHSLTQTTIFDGLGRLSQTQLTSDPSGTTYQLTTYDVLGRKSHVFNPTRCNPPGTNCGETTWGYTSFSYDGLGRVIQATSQDGGTIKTKFTGNVTLVTDQASKQRQNVIDALGRLIEVDEPGTQPPPQANYATQQTDGNFVLYNSSNVALWSTGTSGTNAASIMMQDDGNLVLYIFKWQAGTYAAPSPGPFPPQTCGSRAYLNAGDRLTSGQCIVSPHGQYLLYMAPDGNFYIYDIAHATGTWGANTYGHPGAYATLQMDGNFVVYDVNGVALWNSGTAGTYSERLDMEDDGRIIIYKSAWNSGTATGQWNWTQLTHPACDVGTGTGWTGVLGAGQCFVSPNGHFELLLQADGSLVLNDLSSNPPNTLWSPYSGITPLSPGYSFVTKYFYDGLSNLTCVEQHGNDPNGTGCSAAPNSDANSTWRVRRFTYDTLSRLTSSSNPESNTATTGSPAHFVRVNTTYAYDGNGNLLQRTSPQVNQQDIATQTVSYCYDALNRVTGKAYSAQTCSNGLLPAGTAVASYMYDQTSFNGLTIANGIGRRTGMIDQAGSEAWSYDAMGRPAADKRTLGTVSKTTSYIYNFLGSPTSITYPSANTLNYSYNNAGHPTSVADTAATYAAVALYTPAGMLSSLANGTNLTSKFYYNSRLQPCRVFATTGTANPSNCTDVGTIGNVMDFSYNFNLGAGDNGNVISIANNRDSARTQTFAYDLLNRIASALTNATTGTKCFGESFGYDAWSNLLTISGVNNNYSGCTQENLGAGTNVKNQISTNAYDAAGNMTTGGYTYDAENHLLSAGSVSYTYDGDGRRVQKSSGKLYWYGMGSDPMDETDLGGATNNSGFNEYVFFGGMRMVRRDSTNTVFYYFSDNLGTARIIVQSGQTTPCYDSDFYPFGGERTPIVNTCPQNYKFTGKERDSESGLDDMKARYFGSSLGRFITPDAFYKDSHVADPQSWNKYAYARNNPLRYVDPTGESATVSTSCTNDSQGNTTCNVNISASIAIYAAPGSGLTEEQLTGAATTIQNSIQSAWSGSFSEDGVTYNVSTQVSVSVASSQDAAMSSGAQNVIGLSNGNATATADSVVHPKSPWTAITGGPDTGVWNINNLGNGVAAHEFTHLLGVDDKTGSVLSNANMLNDPTIPHTATGYDLRWGIKEAVDSVNVTRGMMRWGCHEAQCGSVKLPTNPPINTTVTVGAPFAWWK